MKRMIPMLLASSVVGLSGCGGGGGGSTETTTGGGGSTVAGLDMPVTLSVVTAKETSSNARVMGLKANYKAVLAALSDPGTDYTTDPVNTHVYDASIESLSTVNMIMCLMDQTRATDMVNKGAYLALVNEDKCETGKNKSSSGSTGQSSSGQATQYKKWVVNSTRIDNNSPMLVKIWVPGKENATDPRDGQNILIETTVTSGVSATDPFGKFTLNFKGVGSMNGVEFTTMKGTLFTVSNTNGKPQFKFINLEGNKLGNSMPFGGEEATNVVLDDASGTSGKAVTHSEHSDTNQGFSESGSYAVAFNSTRFLRGKETTGDSTIDSKACTARDQFNTNVWRYNLYHAADGLFNGKTVTAGQRVELNSGFPFKYNDKFGHVGYWGVWYEGGDLADGTTIQKVDFGSTASTDYTVHVGPGKLIRRTASTDSLTNYVGYDLQYWGENPSTMQSGQWAVTVDAKNDFYIVGSLAWGDKGPVETPVSPPVLLTPTQDGMNLWLWSDALGGNVTYVHKTTVSPTNRTVTLYNQEFVKPDDALFTGGTVTMYCYDRCLKGDLVQADVDGASGNESVLYYPMQFDSMTSTYTPYAYTAVLSNGKVIVKDHLDKIVDTALTATTSLNLTSVGHDWGIGTSEMVLSTSGIANPWQVYEQAVTYHWETGSNNWNKQITVQKASDNSYASFDKPIDINYTHSTANDANGNTTYDGKKFRLGYGGPGELWGFPWEEDTATGRWNSVVTLKDGITLGNGFVVKGIDKEQTMLEQSDLTSCTNAGLNVDTLLVDLALPVTSDIGTISITLADKPVVTEAPAVIEGELQK